MKMYEIMLKAEFSYIFMQVNGISISFPYHLG